ncbi:MAG: C4-dicarboxylate ABC transporter [Clostridia bacterium]|nr:MAG: C4-dicarboxylate ABC transporter [Clostridia bacterium]
MSTAIIVAIVIFLALMFLKVPVFAAVTAGTCIYLVMTPSVNGIVVVQKLIAGMSSIPLLAIPFFVCAGILMNMSGITKRIMTFCVAITGRMTGGLAQVNVLLSTLMGGLSGSNLADAAMEAKLLVPEMEAQGYSKEFSSVVTAVSAMITPLIPPGIGMIVYGSLANASVGRLFIAGISIGLLLMAAMMVLNYFIAKKRGYVRLREDKITPREFWMAFKQAALPLCLPLLIIGGIRIGVVTATEAGAAAVIFSVVLGIIYKELNLKKILQAMVETVSTTASIMLIIGAVSSIAWVFTKEKIPQTLLSVIVSHIDSKFVFLLLVNLFLIIVGMFVEGNAAAVMLIPMLAPIAAAYGMDLIQFGMIWVFNMSIGGITPPMGTLMYVTCGVTGCKIKDFLREAVPYFIMLFICLMLITYVPQISLWLLDMIWPA